MKACLVIILNLYTLNFFSQCTRIELPVLQIANQQFETIIDSVVIFSMKCEKEELKHLNFKVQINEIEFNLYQFIITIVDQQGLDYLLKIRDSINKPVGYFVHDNQIFIVTGRSIPEDIFEMQQKKKIFNTTLPDLLKPTDYSTWIYTYELDHGFELQKFYPLCD